MVYLTRFSVTHAYTVLNGRMIRKKRNRKECGSGHGLIWRINPESECGLKKIMKKGPVRTGAPWAKI
jgi:hypothetical protein